MAFPRPSGLSRLRVPTYALVASLCAMLCLMPFAGHEAAAQSAPRTEAARAWPTESEVTAYVPARSLSSSDALDVELPPGFSLLAAQALEAGLTVMPLRVETREASPSGGQTYRVTPPRRFAALTEVALRIRTGELEGEAAVRVRAMRFESGRMRVAGTETLRSRTVYALPAPGAFAAHFQGQALPLRAEALPDMGGDASFTIATWMSTPKPGEVVLSAWTGAEPDAYPLDLMTDERGRLMAYQGAPGRHVALSLETPVADGLWHHVAFAYDAERGRSWLYLDGQAVDSLDNPLGSSGLPRARAFALGGRPPAGTARDADAGTAFTGRLDGLRFWPKAASRSDIARLYAAPYNSRDATGALVLDFDEPIPASLLRRGVLPAYARVASDLVVTPPFSAFRASFDDPDATRLGDAPRVRLEWRASPATFFVERSSDGDEFVPVGTVEPRSEGVAKYTFEDDDARGSVAYYRVRQRFAGGRERVSPVLKVGMGTATEQPAVTLEGTFPNPFQSSTTLSYTVYREVPIRATVWDVSGQRVAILADRTHRPGTYRLPFDGSNLPSGTYFVRLELGSRVLSHTMVLAK